MCRTILFIDERETQQSQPTPGHVITQWEAAAMLPTMAILHFARASGLFGRGAHTGPVEVVRVRYYLQHPFKHELGSVIKLGNWACPFVGPVMVGSSVLNGHPVALASMLPLIFKLCGLDFDRSGWIFNVCLLSKSPMRHDLKEMRYMQELPEYLQHLVNLEAVRQGMSATVPHSSMPVLFSYLVFVAWDRQQNAFILAHGGYGEE